MRRTADAFFIIVILLMMLLPSVGFLGAKGRLQYTALNAYVEENIGFRSELISLYAKASEGLFSQTGNVQVLLGKEGWLYFADTLPDYCRRNVLPEVEITQIARSLAALSESLASRGIGFTFLCAPNKNTIYPEYMPYYTVSPGGPGNLDCLQNALRAAGVDVLDAAALLRFAKADGQPLYLKTDTHWNARGALLVYRALMERLAAGKEGVSYDAYDLPFADSVAVHGDLSVLYLPFSKTTEEDALPVIERRYSVDGLMRSLSDMVIRTRSGANGLAVLVLRDSFGEALFPYLANNIGRLVFTRGIHVDETLLEGEAITHVVLEIAERNIHTLLPADSHRAI